jgi:hypothetical protein
MKWKYWQGKKVYILTKKDRIFTGTIQEVDDSNPLLVWIVIIDRYNKLVQLCASEISEIKEEADRDDSNYY